MKKANLLSRSEMKKVLGGVRDVVPADGCSDSSVCPEGQACCPFTDTSGSVGTRCSDLFDGPNGSKLCGNA